MKHQAPAARWAAALTAAFAMSQADAAAAPAVGAAASHDHATGSGLARTTAGSGHQHYLADDAALLEGPQHLWGVG